ncbi:hypothetical protein ACO0K1_00255 [Undibacterium sp. SXout20W]
MTIIRIFEKCVASTTICHLHLHRHRHRDLNIHIQEHNISIGI